MNRRQFTKSALAASIASITLPQWLTTGCTVQNSSYAKTIGIQLWTVRNQLEADMPATLKAIKEAGYAQVELMSTLGQDELVKTAKNLGLGVTSAFVNWQSVVDPTAEGVPSTDEIIAKAKEYKLKYLVFGYIGKGHRETSKQLTTIAASANAFGKQCKEAGIQLCYHHHSFEFGPLEDDSTKTGFDVFCETFDPNLVKWEIDVFWVAVGGLDPVKVLTDLKGNVAQVHLKDLLAGTPTSWDEGTVLPEAFKELGNGRLDMNRIIEVCQKTGVAQCHVEQDQSPDPIASIGTSIQFLKNA